MTSVLRYRAEEDESGVAVPPKPHRLKPLGDEELDRTSSGADATNSEDANATEAAVVPRPPNGESLGQSPKARQVKASASGAPAHGESIDSLSGASTADTVTPADDLVPVPPAGAKPKKAPPPFRGSMFAGTNSREGDVADTDRIPKVRSCSVHGTGWTTSAGVGSAKLQQRRSVVGRPVTMGSAREICNFFYHQAEQHCLWVQMQSQASSLLSDDTCLLGHVHPTDCANDDELMTETQQAAVLLEMEEEGLDELQEKPQAALKVSPKTVRRQSIYILKGEIEAEDAATETTEAKIKGDDNTSAPTGSAPAAALTGPNPLKECITAKKVDVDQCRAIFKTIGPDLNMWIEAPLDVGPPLVPKAMVFACATSALELVELLIEHGADVCSPYDGPSMYKGCVKPGMTLLSSVTNRKGRFVGTMLGERLTKIETLIATAVASKKQQQVEDEEAPNEAVSEEMEVVEETVEEIGRRKFTKSVSVKITGGNTMRHTQGHPGDVFEISEHLGDGDRSSVWLGFHKEAKTPVAIKTEQKSATIEIWLWEEINLMRKVRHPNVAQLFETFESEKQIFMVLELCEGGRLLDKCTPEGCTEIMKSPHLMRQTALAVEYLHSKFIAHRDIQLDNFLLADDKPLSEATVKLIDFTTTKMFGHGQPPLKTKICTPGYVAKEILTRKEIPYTEKVDVWSLGVVFFIMLSGSPPFYGDTDFDTLKQVKKGSFKFAPEDRWSSVPNEAKDLISKMIHSRVEERLSSKDVVAHPFIAMA